MKRLLLAVMLILFLSLRCYAVGTEDGYYEMRYADLQVMAVTTDMFLPLGWYPEDKEAIQSDSFQAVKDLEDIVSYIESLDLPEELQGVSIEYTQFIRSLQDIYTGIEIPGDVNSPEIFNKLWKSAIG